MEIAHDCRYFLGDMPCIYHKLEKKVCTCEHYDQIKGRILIVKLGELGDVIRTTPIITRIKEDYPNSHITWITHTPEFLPDQVDAKLKFNEKNVVTLQAQEFDLLLNFDKEKESCAIASLVTAKKKKGFILKDGKCHPIDKDSEYKFFLGLDDEFNKKNRKSYMEQIFEMAGYKFDKAKYRYLMKNPFKYDIPLVQGRKVIGLNTGCGSRWPTRMWPEHKWTLLAKNLMKNGYVVLMLGGPNEDERNKRIAEESGAQYLGHHSLKTFISLIDICDVIVTSITMALHIGIGLNKKVIAFNNIFNRAEFELYGNGEILEPNLPCLGCYKNQFDEKCPVPNCMEEISVERVISSIENQVVK